MSFVTIGNASTLLSYQKAALWVQSCQKSPQQSPLGREPAWRFT